MKPQLLFPYKDLKNSCPIPKKDQLFLSQTKTLVKNIFLKKEKKLIIFAGPCSIHDEENALLYAKKLKNLQKNLKNVFLIMRAYFEKPRTKNSWKGFLYDPDLNNSYNIKKGIINVRNLLIKLTRLQVPIATEFLDPNAAYFFDDLITWGIIGTRTTASPLHRHLASNLNIPIGFKNTLNGDIEIAINSAIASQNKQTFIGLNQEGKICQVSSKGNPFTHIVLRGSKISINYDKKSIIKTLKIIKENNVNFPLVIDCSHGNCQKNYKNQIKAFKYSLNLIKEKTFPIIGLMLESHLNEGKQPLDPLNLKFGVSITDPCIDFETTKDLVLFAEDILEKKFSER